MDPAITSLQVMTFFEIAESEVSRLAQCMDDLLAEVKDLDLLESREFTRSYRYWIELGRERGITGEAARQRFIRDTSRVRNHLTEDRFRVISRATGYLQDDFGTVISSDSDTVDQWRALLGERRFEALRWLSNYTYDDHWLVLGAKSRLSELRKAIDEVIGDAWLCQADDVPFSLDYNVRPDTVLRLLVESGQWRDIGDGWLVLWDGPIRVKAARVLELVGRPMTAAEIVEKIGHGSERTLKQQGNYLVRIDQKFRLALPEWGYEEYEGIATEIIQRIARGGGVASRAAIISEISESFGVRVSSILAYLSLPAFDVDEDMVRLAESPEFTPKQPWMIPGTIRTVKGWGERQVLTDLNMKGHSFRLDRHVAWANGIRPSDSLRVPINGTSHKASVIWRTTSLTGKVEIGRVRAWCEENRLRVGEELLLCPSSSGVTIFVGESRIEAAREAYEATTPTTDTDAAAQMEEL